MKKIGIDFDAVLVQSDLILCQILTEKLGYVVLPERIKAYAIEECCPELSSDDVRDVIEKLVCMEYTFQIPQYPGALDFLKWYGKSNEIIIITNRIDLEPVEVYLRHHLDKNTFDQIRLFYAKEKGPLARSLGLEYFIEDHLVNVINLANHGVIPILFRQNWNENVISKRSNLFDLVHFVNSWEDIYYFVGCELFGY